MQKTTAPASKDGSCFFAFSEQISSLGVFFSSANWHTYFGEFQHAEGLSTLLRVLAVERSPTAETKMAVSDRETLLQILIQISRRGRGSKEEVSQLGGEIAIIQGPLSWAMSDPNRQVAPNVIALCRELLVEQFVGNPANVSGTSEAIKCMLESDNAVMRVFGAQVTHWSMVHAIMRWGCQFDRLGCRFCVRFCVRL